MLKRLHLSHHKSRDDGQEIFDEEDYIDGGTSNANRRAKKAGATGPRVRKAKAVKKRVNSLFTGGGKASRLGAAVVKLDDEKTVGSEDSFLVCSEPAYIPRFLPPLT